MNALAKVLASFGAWVVSTLTTISTNADGAAGVSVTASCSFNTDGSITNTTTPFDAGSSGGTKWFTQITAGIGSNYYVRFTPTTGTFTTNGASTFTQMNANRACTKSATSGAVSVTFTIEIATDSGGTNIVFTKTGNVLSYAHTL